MASNFFGLLEDVSSNDPVEIAKKRQQDATNAKKQQEKKQAEDKQKESAAAKKTTQQKKPQSAPRQTGGETGGDVAAEGFEQRDNRAKRGGRGGRGGKHHVAPRTGRQFDRESGTGRGKEISKNGGGARNWGKAGDEVVDVESNTQRKPFKKNFQKKDETVATPTTPSEEKPETPVENAETAETPVEDKKPEEQEEEEDNTITYDKLLAEKRKQKSQKPVARKAGEGVTTDPALLKGEVVQKKKAEDIDLPIQEEGVLKKKKATDAKTEKKEKKTQSHDNRLGLGEFFKGDKDALESLSQAQQYRPPRSSRGGGRGRGSSRGGNRGGNRGGRGRPTKTTPSFNKSDFPDLK